MRYPTNPSSTLTLKSPSVSPYYASLEEFRGRLPHALFTCGTDDPLLDDSVNMGVKWQMSGGKAVIKIYPGAPHAFIGFVEVSEEARKAVHDTRVFIWECLGEL
jgi:acetyl esterase/lipase